MALPTAAEAAKNWADGLSQATAKIGRGIDRVTDSPMEKAAASQDLWAMRTAEAARNGKFAKGLRRVPLQSWKDAAKKKGLPRIAGGAAEAQPKMQAFLTEFLPHVAAVQAQVNAIPKGGIEASKARMLANMEGMAAFKRS